ncbi:MAG TPA: hypothetical protein VJB57_01575 [Dehalococcoidia bacterium]|nr:hypothetical protein [Dehalococcoidia bacterium]
MTKSSRDPEVQSIVDEWLTHPLSRRLSEATNHKWYVQKCRNTPNEQAVRDHLRAVKYATHFINAGARVSFIREVKGRRTPDLQIEHDGASLLVEVKRFGSSYPVTSHPVEKIADVIREKSAQLPEDLTGLVAIDNFDSLGLESADLVGWSHASVLDAFAEIERRGRENPSGWRKPSAVVFAASTTWGTSREVGDVPVFPHYLWLNPQASPTLSEALAAWVCSALPGAEIIDGSESRKRHSRYGRIEIE